MFSWQAGKATWAAAAAGGGSGGGVSSPASRVPGAARAPTVLLTVLPTADILVPHAVQDHTEDVGMDRIILRM
jgi:hypothetical protein